MDYRDAATQIEHVVRRDQRRDRAEHRGPERRLHAISAVGQHRRLSASTGPTPAPRSTPTRSCGTSSCPRGFNDYNYMGLFNTTRAARTTRSSTSTCARAYEGRLFADRDSDNGKVYTPTASFSRTRGTASSGPTMNHATEDIRIFVDGVKVAPAMRRSATPVSGCPTSSRCSRTAATHGPCAGAGRQHGPGGSRDDRRRDRRSGRTEGQLVRVDLRSGRSARASAPAPR